MRIVFDSVYKYVLRGVKLEVSGAGLYTLLGPNGSGKTTTLRLAAGIIKPDKGRVLIDGCNPYREYKVRARITYVAVHPLADAFETAYGYLSFYLKTTPSSLRGNLSEALKFFSLENLVNEPLHRLSTGQRRRVELAKLLLKKAPYILVDEPTTSLDPEARAKVVNLLKGLSRNALVFIATSDLDLARELRSNVIMLRNGVVESVYDYDKFEKTLHTLAKKYIVIAKILWKASSGDPKNALKKYGQSVEVNKAEIDVSALLKSLGIEVSGKDVKVSVIWVNRKDLSNAMQSILVASITPLLHVESLPMDIEIAVGEGPLVPRVIEDLMSFGEVIDLRILRAVG